MAFEIPVRPENIASIAEPLPSSTNASGLQGAHITGQSFWNNNLGWLSQLNEPGSNAIKANSLFNGVLLPESGLGSVALGVATHSGQHVLAFDNLFYENPLENAASTKFLNVLKDNLEAALNAAGNDESQIALVRAESRIELRNFTDFVKTLFLSQEILDKNLSNTAPENVSASDEELVTHRLAA